MILVELSGKELETVITFMKHSDFASFFCKTSSSLEKFKAHTTCEDPKIFIDNLVNHLEKQKTNFNEYETIALSKEQWLITFISMMIVLYSIETDRQPKNQAATEQIIICVRSICYSICQGLNSKSSKLN